MALMQEYNFCSGFAWLRTNLQYFSKKQTTAEASACFESVDHLTPHDLSLNEKSVALHIVGT